MTTTNNTTADVPADHVLVLTREFDAPRALVFEAWTTKEHIDKWSFPRGFTMPESQVDFRVGGEFRHVMIDPDGGKNVVTGIYREIVPNELLIMTHGWHEDDGSRPYETIVTARFADAGEGRTRITLEQRVFRSVQSRNAHNVGWSESFDKLAELAKEPEAEMK